MQVTVRVIDGGSMTADTPTLLTIEEPQAFQGNIASVTLPGTAGKTIHISSNSAIRLTNNRGTNIELRVIGKKSAVDTDIHYSIDSVGIKREDKDTADIPDGMYNGAITTRIEYF